MHSEIITNDECVNCGRPGMVLESEMCPMCHEVIAWATWAGDQTDVIETGPIEDIDEQYCSEWFIQGSKWFKLTPDNK